MSWKTYTANEVADALIKEMARQEKPVDNLKVNKLLFFADGIYFVITQKPLVKDDFEAWVHGPVIPDLYHRFKGFGWQNLDVNVAKSEGPSDEEVREAIKIVVDQLGGLSGYELELRSHQVPSYLKARAGLADDEPSRNIIPKDETHEYFKKLFDRD